jgi:hypothetical protein
MIHHIYKQVLYVLISTLLLYIIYQLIIFKKKNINDQLIKTDSGNKVRIFIQLLILSSFVIFYFNIGVDELQIGGEQRLNDVIRFEKSMIDNIRQDVSIGKVPF